MDVRTHANTFEIYSGTKDLQHVAFTLRLLTHLNPDKAPEVYRRFGEDYESRILRSAVNEVVNATVATHNAESLIEDRNLVYHQIVSGIRSKLDLFDLVTDDISVVSMKYSDDFTKSCEYKMITQQAAQRQEYYVLQSQRERDAQITLAEGESRAATMITKSIAKHGNGYLKLKQIDVYIIFIIYLFSMELVQLEICCVIQQLYLFHVKNKLLLFLNSFFLSYY